MRILVVEDEDEIAEFMLRGLREEGFVVDRAADRDTAWHALTTGKWDAVLLDLSLAGADGLELLRRLRRTDPITPVVVVTARATVEARVLGLDAGADDYLCKPFA